MVGSVTKAMGEQSKAMREIASASESMMTQADQTTRAIKDQARTMKDMTGAAQSTLKQIKLITHANREHSTVAARVLDQLREIRQITDRNARDVLETRGTTAQLMKHAADLAGLVANGNGKRNGTHGRG